MAEQSRHAKEYTRSSHSTQEAESSSWVYETFKKKRCSHYIPCKEEPNRCGCGRSKASHDSTKKDGPTNRKHELTEPGQETIAVEWNAETDGPTDAFGELEFTGAGQTSRAKFIRISDDTDAEDVLRLLQEEWKLELPKLVISVAGGGKNFVMHPKLKDLFRQGLLKAAKTTGAWIITGGTNTGVMKHVGEAVKGHTVMSRGAMLTDKTPQVHLIGIPPWGIVEHRSELTGKDLVTYHMTSSLENQGWCIDNNHSHFLLVDDGTEGEYGGEIKFRARLQNCLANKEISKRYNYLDENSQNGRPNGIPVVLLVLEGGPNTIRTVLESVTSTPAVPVVIADGSGRAADILAYAYSLYIEHQGFDMKHFRQVAEHEILELRIKKAFPGCSENEWSKCYSNVLECVKKSQYITTCHMDDVGMDIDKLILKAILKAKSTSPSYQLDLALTWNRADIARTEIFTKDRKWKVRV